MTKEQMDTELLYHASLSPFKCMLSEGLISEDDYRVIDTILRAKYSPVFVCDSIQI
jgi:hypothetical protein